MITRISNLHLQQCTKPMNNVPDIIPRLSQHLTGQFPDMGAEEFSLTTSIKLHDHLLKVFRVPLSKTGKNVAINVAIVASRLSPQRIQAPLASKCRRADDWVLEAHVLQQPEKL